MILHDWDPIGIRGYEDGPEDEYDSYVPDICYLIMRGTTFEELFAYLWWLETEHMGLPGQRQRAEQFAKRLLEVAEEFRKSIP
jgi:hypothetical protein